MNLYLIGILAAILAVVVGALWMRRRLQRQRDEEAQREAEQLAMLEATRASAPASTTDALPPPLATAEPVAPADVTAAEAAQREADDLRAAEAAAFAEAERLIAESLSAQRAREEAAAQAEAERLAAEAAAQAQAERLAAEAAAQAQAERLAAEAAAQAEAERLAAEAAAQAEAERLAAEAAAQAEAERLAAVAAVATRPLSPQETIVLLADDSKIVRVKTSRVLTPQGYQVQLAESAEEAIEKMAAGLPHVLITDVEMPGMDGFALTRHVRADPRTATLPVIMITSSDDKQQQAADAGVTTLLGKPYSEEALIACIEEARLAVRVPA